MRNHKSDLGILGVLVFVRLYKIQEMIINKNESIELKNYARDQLSLNNCYQNGMMHTLTNNLMVLVSERMMNIA